MALPLDKQLEPPLMKLAPCSFLLHEEKVQLDILILGSFAVLFQSYGLPVTYCLIATQTYRLPIFV